MTSTINTNTVDALADVLREGLGDIKNRGEIVNEDITKDALIYPTLVALGYPPNHRIPEYNKANNIPDICCYINPISAIPGFAAVLVEAKEYGTDFDKRPPGRPRSESPDRQIQRYVKYHKASGPASIGVLTDGIKWRIYRRAGTPRRRICR